MAAKKKSTAKKKRASGGARKRKRAASPRVGQTVPGVYDKELDYAARVASSNGFINYDLADLFDVSITILEQWLTKHKSFRAAVELGREERLTRVERSLYERAMGYEHKEEKILVINDKVVRVQTIKKYPPCTKALSFFLRNTNPNRWKDKHEVEIVDDSAARIKAARKRKRKARESEPDE